MTQIMSAVRAMTLLLHLLPSCCCHCCCRLACPPSAAWHSMLVPQPHRALVGSGHLRLLPADNRHA